MAAFFVTNVVGIIANTLVEGLQQHLLLLLSKKNFSKSKKLKLVVQVFFTFPETARHA